MRRVWQKRRCAVQAEGYLDICHADENKPPTRVNLLTCQIKLVPDDKRGFDLISCECYVRLMYGRMLRVRRRFVILLFIVVVVPIADNRTYHFQAEDEADQRAWMSVLVNCKERALLRAFDASGKAEAGSGNPSLVELQQAVIRCVMRLPGNDQCCDCSSQNGNSERNNVNGSVGGRPFSNACQVCPLYRYVPETISSISMLRDRNARL